MFYGIRYQVNRGIRTTATRVMSRFPETAQPLEFDLRKEGIEKILLVRPNFRMGNSILAIPGIFLFLKNFPAARIDFVGSPVSRLLCQNLPINNHYEVTRSFAQAWRCYPMLLLRLRSVRYDLAVDLSCSQSALGSFIVGCSGARFKVGRKGKWDFWYNVKLPKPTERNKYRRLPALLATMGLRTEDTIPRIILSTSERSTGRKLLEGLTKREKGPLVGLSVGGRERRGKRWPAENFLKLILKLKACGIQTIVFIGPEEKQLVELFKKSVGPDIPVIYEPALRSFAAMLSNCHLFVSCDSGPMHLACALGVRTIAIFQNPDFDRWGPPSCLARIIHNGGCVSVEMVEHACLAELDYIASVRTYLRWPLSR